jgi:hypothetical protein
MIMLVCWMLVLGTNQAMNHKNQEQTRTLLLCCMATIGRSEPTESHVMLRCLINKIIYIILNYCTNVHNIKLLTMTYDVTSAYFQKKE